MSKRRTKIVDTNAEAVKELEKQLKQATKQQLLWFALERLSCNLGDNGEVYDNTVNVNIKIKKSS